MPQDLPRPITYLITNGQTTISTNPNSPEFSEILRLVESAVAAQISLIQIREKNLAAKAVFELTSQALSITRGTETRVLVNDRFDIALAAGADGVHLTSRSLSADVVRKHCGEEFLIGVSTHALTEAVAAQQNGSNFVLFGPVFQTDSKREFGPAQGTDKLREVAARLKPFPVLAIGGISLSNLSGCFAAGASGIAAINLFSDSDTLARNSEAVRLAYER